MTLTSPELILPPHLAHERAASNDTPPEPASRLLPKPAGYHLLCAIPQAKESFEDSKLVKSKKLQEDEESGTNVLFVLDVGPDAYKDTVKFPSGPWAKKEDFVLVRRYAGTRFKIFGKEFVLINDDQVEAVVADPRGLTNAY